MSYFNRLQSLETPEYLSARLDKLGQARGRYPHRDGAAVEEVEVSRDEGASVEGGVSRDKASKDEG